MRRRAERRPSALAAALLVALCLVGVCPPGRSAAETTIDDALLVLRREDARVAAVAFRLASANVDLCDETAPLLGLTLHSARQYSLRLRAAAQRVYGLDGRPQVLAVAPGGPADLAGVKAGDTLAAINDQGVEDEGSGAARAAPSYAQVAATMQALAAAAAGGPVRLSLVRGGQSLPLAIVPTPGCAYDTQLMPSDAIDASADGDHVFITTALAHYAATDDDLALVLGHELGHDVLHHRRRLDAHGFARKLLGNLGSSPASLVRVEREADYVGLYLTARAGFDISRADAFWLRFAADHGDAWYEHWGHPGSRARARSIAATRDEILGLRGSGEPLVPQGLAAAKSGRSPLP